MKYYGLVSKVTGMRVIVNLTQEEAQNMLDLFPQTEVRLQPKRLLLNLETFMYFKPQIANAMRSVGGSFVRALGEALDHADHFNTKRIYHAFSDYCENYYINYLTLKERNNVDTVNRN